MPEFIRPKRAIIEPDDSSLLAMIGIAAVILGGGLALASVAAWIMGHAVLLLTCLGVFVLVLGGFCVWSAWITSPARREAQRQTEQRRQLLETLPPARDIPADQMPMPKRATWPRIDTGYAKAVRQSPSSAHGKEV